MTVIGMRIINILVNVQIFNVTSITSYIYVRVKCSMLALCLVVNMHVHLESSLVQHNRQCIKIDSILYGKRLQ